MGYAAICDVEILREAWHATRRGGSAPGVDGQTLAEFEADVEQRLRKLANDLRNRRYCPSPFRRSFLRKTGGGHRPLAIPTIRDRIVQQAIRQVLERVLEPNFAASSFAYRPNLGVEQAMDRLLKQLHRGHTWVLESDVENFFDSIHLQTLWDRLGNVVADRELLDLVRTSLTAGVAGTRTVRKSFQPRCGLPQGSPLSPLLSNFYLTPFDRVLEKQGYALTRYADDLVVSCPDRRQAARAREDVTAALRSLRLRVSVPKTRIINARWESFEFLGFLRHPRYLWPSPAKVTQFETWIKQVTEPPARTSVDSLIKELNPPLRSFGYYYRRCDVGRLFRRFDRIVCRRLTQLARSIENRTPRTGSGWAGRGLVSLTSIRDGRDPHPPDGRDGYGGPIVPCGNRTSP